MRRKAEEAVAQSSNQKVAAQVVLSRSLGRAQQLDDAATADLDGAGEGAAHPDAEDGGDAGGDGGGELGEELRSSRPQAASSDGVRGTTSSILS